MPRNPLALPLAICGFASLGLAGVAALLKFDLPLNLILLPMALACMLLLLGYTLFALRLGWITCVDHVGKLQHFQRQKSPVTYWFLVALYLLVSLPAGWYLLVRLVSQ